MQTCCCYHEMWMLPKDQQAKIPFFCTNLVVWHITCLFNERKLDRIDGIFTSRGSVAYQFTLIVASHADPLGGCCGWDLTCWVAHCTTFYKFKIWEHIQNLVASPMVSTSNLFLCGTQLKGIGIWHEACVNLHYLHCCRGILTVLNCTDVISCIIFWLLAK